MYDCKDYVIRKKEKGEQVERARKKERIKKTEINESLRKK